MALNLTQVPTQVLVRLRDAVASGRLSLPLSPVALRSSGFSALAELPGLTGLGQESLLVVADAVIAERKRASNPAELVWTGPENRAGESRDTAVVVQRLFASADRHVTIAGFRFDHGASLLESLHSAMRDRQVNCTVYADGTDAEEFLGANWPFGPPFPEVHSFVPPNGVYASLHAKCMVVDHLRVLITSANFTERGHQRNIEVGVLLDDPELARVLEGQLGLLAGGTPG